MASAGWIKQLQEQAIQYLMTENRVLKETDGKKRILLNDDQRRRLAVKAKVLGRKTLEQVATIVTPVTLLLAHGEEVGRASGEIETRERLGGLLRYYYRKAA